jgi:general nucleoside transport system ATP-binding protein
MQAAPLVNMLGITKSFPGVMANDGVDLELRSGEVLALLGENGAGKSSLMSVLYGLYRPDAGEIRVAGKPAQIRSPLDAIRLGIGFVAQHPLLVRRHTVAENIALGLNGGFFNPVAKVKTRILELSQKYGLEVHPDAPVWSLSAGEQQRVEIIKALARGAKVLILDEPTSVLTPQEAEELFKVLRRMKLEGEGVILITHKLDEVMAVADRITVLRKGKVVGQITTNQTNPTALAALMIGRQLEPVRALHDTNFGQPVLRLEQVNVLSDRGVPAIRDVTLEIRAGEVLGVAGVAGNGQRELIEAITGLRTVTSGSIKLETQNITNTGAKHAAKSGIAHIPEDRLHMGVVGNLTVSDNLALRGFETAPFAKGEILEPSAFNEFATRAIEDFDIATPNAQTPVRLLSGGNIQKVIFARELEGNPKLIVAAHPTYGLDAGATAQVQRLLLERAQAGTGVMLVSEDLDEVLALSTRVAVLFDGRLMGVLERDDATRERVGLLMAGRNVEGLEVKA